METCKKCGAKEVPANTPRTTYECGSSDYDQRPDTFIQSEKCTTMTTPTQAGAEETLSEKILRSINSTYPDGTDIFFTKKLQIEEIDKLLKAYAEQLPKTGEVLFRAVKTQCAICKGNGYTEEVMFGSREGNLEIIDCRHCRRTGEIISYEPVPLPLSGKGGEESIESIFEWMTKSGYDRRASKEISEIIFKYLSTKK